MKLFAFSLFLFSFSTFSHAVENETFKVSPQIYEYYLYDSSTNHRPNYFSMTQANKLLLSTYRQSMRYFREQVENQWIYLPINIATPIFIPAYTHEEGHRSILTMKNIRAENTAKRGRVTGLKNIELEHLRNDDLPTFIYLHTAGAESDLLNAQDIMDQWFYRNEPQTIMISHYIKSKISVFFYHVMKSKTWRNEERDEENRDIVGHDFFGATRHLHRPDMPYTRYTKWEDFTETELNFYKNRPQQKTWINWLDGYLFTRFLRFKETYDWNIVFDYNMVPYGDEERAHIYYRSKDLNLRADAIYGHNRSHAFPGLNLHLERFSISPTVNLSSDIGAWNQPRNLDFNTDKSFLGWAASIVPEYRLDQLVSCNWGFYYKSKGYQRGASTLSSIFYTTLGVGLIY